MKITMKNRGQLAYLALGSMTLMALPVVLTGCTGSGGGSGMASSGGSTSTTVATVDGTNITRADLQAYAEALSGEQALPQMIDYELLMKDLKSKGLEVSDEEVKAILAKQRQSMSPEDGKRIDALMQSGAPQAEAYRRQAKRRIAIDKILSKDVKADEADVKKWFDKNKATRYPMHFNVGVLLTAQKARADAMERQLASKSKTFKQLVEEQKKLTDPLSKQSTEDSKQPMTLDMVPPTMGDAIKNTKPGETSKVLSLSGGQPGQPGAYAIIRVIEKTESSYEALRAEVETDYKLEQVARQEFKKSAPPTMTFEAGLKQIRENLGQQAMQQAMQTGQMAPPPTDADAVAALTRASESKLLTDLRQAGKVQVSDAVYQTIGELYKPAPAAIAPMMPEGGAPSNSAPAGDAPKEAPTKAPAN